MIRWMCAACVIGTTAMAEPDCRLTQSQWDVMRGQSDWDAMKAQVCKGQTQVIDRGENRWVVMQWIAETDRDLGLELAAVAFDDDGGALEFYWDPITKINADKTVQGFFDTVPLAPIVY